MRKSIWRFLVVGVAVRLRNPKRQRGIPKGRVNTPRSRLGLPSPHRLQESSKPPRVQSYSDSL